MTSSADSIITHDVPLSEMESALEVMGSAERIKVVVKPGG